MWLILVKLRQQQLYTKETTVYTISGAKQRVNAEY